VVLVAAFLTGWLAFSFATAPSRWSILMHALSGFGIIALTPWKSIIVRRSLPRRRPGWWASVSFSILILLSLLAGLLHSTGLLRWAGGITAMEVHVGAAIAAVPFAIWHVIAHRIPLRRTDFSRRSLLRAGGVLAGAGLAYAATGGLVRLIGLPGARRRFTGSYEVASLQPELMPVTQWMFDSVPGIDSREWRLTVRSGGGSRQWSYDELLAFDDRLQATLDCTGGFYSTQDWAGVWLSRLIAEPGNARSVHVRSHAGFDRRFPVEELPRLLLATRVGDQRLSAEHGYPARIISADRRGFWWIKWVISIEANDVPYWLQLPFPMQ
jgi:hypothetical protein